jgi:hypothetical protein
MPEIYATPAKNFLAETAVPVENSGYRHDGRSKEKFFCWDLVYEILKFSNISFYFFFVLGEPRCCLMFFVVFEAVTRCLSWWLLGRSWDPAVLELATLGLLGWCLIHSATQVLLTE